MAESIRNVKSLKELAQCVIIKSLTNKSAERLAGEIPKLLITELREL